MIYLDNNATTKPCYDAMSYAFTKTLDSFGNPSSMHSFGKDAADTIYEARQRVALSLGCKPEEICFTSGGTEANAIALNRGPIFCTATEHSSVYNKMWKERDEVPDSRCGIKVHEGGNIDLDHLESQLCDFRGMLVTKNDFWGVVSIMLANNETGVISDPGREAYDLCHKYGCLLHVDAVQGFGKHGVPQTVDEIKADMLSISGHKIHAPKGVGALYIKEDIRGFVAPLLGGGSHERGMRSGTENAFGIIALGHVCKSMLASSYLETQHGVALLRDYLETELSDIAQVNGNKSERIGNTSNLYFPDVIDLEEFIDLLSFSGLGISGKSACHSGMPTPSRVLTAMYGKSSPRLEGSIRLSLSKWTERSQVESAISIIRSTIDHLKNRRNNGE